MFFISSRSQLSKPFLTSGFNISTAVVSSLLIRMISGLPTTFKLNNPSLLHVPESLQQSKKGKETLEVLNPCASYDQVSDGSAVIALLNSHTKVDAKEAVEASSAAFKTWSTKTTATKRSRMLLQWSELIKENEEDIAKIMTLESGKPLKESIGEIGYGRSFLDFFAGEAIRPTNSGGGIIYPSPFASADGAPKGKVMVIHEPVGVTAHITPWNFPMAMITRKAAPALAAGCTVVLKPSEMTPLTAMALHRLALEAGIPKDVFQLVVADAESTPEIGTELCTNPLVKKITFTGSTRVGKLLLKMTSDTVKLTSMELGGNASFILFDDADIDQAVNAAMGSKFRNAGQACVASDRFLIHESIEKEFVEKFCAKVNALKTGDGFETDTTMGPLISAVAAKHVREKVDEAIADGAECVAGGKALPDLGPNFYAPTILRNVATSSQIWKTETFGPVAAMRTFVSEEEAVELANDTSAGLASYICTKDMDRVFRVTSRLENGLIGVNEGVISTAVAPFGGVKESGLGVEGSSEGLSEFVESKYIFLNH